MLISSPLSGGEIKQSHAYSFDRDVQPILASHCLKCHGPEKQKGPLANLFVTMQKSFGVEAESFADSTGEITEVLA